MTHSFQGKVQEEVRDEIPVACNKTRGSGLTSSKHFSATQHTLVYETPHSPKSVADAGWISETGIKDRMGQAAGCILQRMVGILQVGTKSSQNCLPCTLWDPSPAS